MSVPTIAILGGGPSGLSLARLLEVNNIDYVVYERDASPEVETQGGSLDIHSKSGQLVLKEAALFEEFKKYARWDDSKSIVQDKTGTTLLEFGEGDDAPEIDRAALRKILLESIPPSKIKWNHAVASVERNASGEFAVNFKNGGSATGFKLVVGADGAWSKARHLVSRDSSLSHGITTYTRDSSLTQSLSILASITSRPRFPTSTPSTPLSPLSSDGGTSLQLATRSKCPRSGKETDPTASISV